QLRLLALWNSREMVSSRLLCYDATNFYTFIASTNERTTLAQRGHNKQGRNNLRQVGLSFILDGIHGLSLGHHVYPGDVSDSGEFNVSLSRILQGCGSHAGHAQRAALRSGFRASSMAHLPTSCQG
ncbi:MAG: hypothetical protein ACRDGM_15840, partial [bacterium]